MNNLPILKLSSDPLPNLPPGGKELFENLFPPWGK